MKIYVIVAAISTIIGALIATKYFPKIVEKPIEVVKIETKTKTVTREVVRPNGQIEREIIVASEYRSETQSKLPTKWHVSLQKDILSRRSDAISLTISRRFIGPVFLTTGINTEKQISVGVGIEF